MPNLLNKELPDILRAANFQWNIRKRDFPGNLAVVDRFLEKAAERGTNLVSFPEMWSQSFCGPDLLKEARLLENRLDELAFRARKYDLWIAAGTLPEPTAEGKVFNTFHLLDPDGKVRYRFRKVHPFPHARENQYLASPTENLLPDVFSSGKWKVGAGVCFDIKFPELFRKQMLMGANLFFIPAQIPRERLEHFVLLSAARAIENMSLVVSTNRCGEGASMSFPGGSQIIDPDGNSLSRLGNEEDCGFAEFDVRRLLDLREKMPFLSYNPLL